MEKISIRKAKFAKIGLQDLCHYIVQQQPSRLQTMVEIGSFVGDSTEIFAKHFKTVYAVDPWESGYDDSDGASHMDMQRVEAQFDLLIAENPRIVKCKMSSLDFASLITPVFVDFVYVDGNHQYEAVKADIEAWLPKIRPGGFIGGHDWQNPPHPGVERAVGETVGKPDKTFKDTSWIKQLQ